jgi:pimeloyl-ACP methyl ester carboxylesterase
LLTGCVQSGPDRDANATTIAQGGGLDALLFRGSAFDLQLYRRSSNNPGPTFVYIEGDGDAYLDPRTPSPDPTPIDPLTLRLAAIDRGPAVIYVGRPCQFAPGRNDRRCTTKNWTTGRFSRDSVAAIDDAIERARDPQRPLVLVGYSGGGVIAALVAARRRDVSLLITLAAPLDIADWTHRMALSPLDGSDSPADQASSLARIPQIHFAGQRDRTVPVETIQSFIDKLGASARAKLIAIPDFDHRCCWLRDWPRLHDTAWNSADRKP